MDTTIQPTEETSEPLALVPVDTTAEDVRVGDRLRIGAADYAVTRKGSRGEAVFFDLADQAFTIGFDEFEVVTVLRSYSRGDVYGQLLNLMRNRELPPPHSLAVKPGVDIFDVDVDVDTEDGFNRWAEALGMDAERVRRSAPFKSHPGWRQRLSVSARSYTGPTWLGMDTVDLAATIDVPEPTPEPEPEAVAAQDAEQIVTATLAQPEPDRPACSDCGETDGHADYCSSEPTPELLPPTPDELAEPAIDEDDEPAPVNADGYAGPAVDLKHNIVQLTEDGRRRRWELTGPLGAITLTVVDVPAVGRSTQPVAYAEEFRAHWRTPLPDVTAVSYAECEHLDGGPCYGENAMVLADRLIGRWLDRNRDERVIWDQLEQWYAELSYTQSPAPAVT